MLYGALRTATLSYMALALAMFFMLLAIVQLLAWLFVPDTKAVSGTRAHRRQDAMAIVMVAALSVYLASYPMLELFSNYYVNKLSMDSLLYECLHLALNTAPTVVLSIVGVLTYWNDVKFADAENAVANAAMTPLYGKQQ
jgi:hypothetical protein